ncbi:MAG TPA: VTT domain-containing protein [Pseudolabrys sp.]|nr:VTT domain-containing protein [Pseudolabrys sp.]
MLMRPDKTFWRRERATRAAVLIDAAQYFSAARAAMLKARAHIFIVGWDIHSRTRFVGESGSAQDGYPESFGDFLSKLSRERPKLKIHVLLWDFAVLYAPEREFFPVYALRWNTPPGVDFYLDNAVPFGSSQHQKLIVVDDSVAFSGGLDVTIRRWDTSAHEYDHPLRHDPAGKYYRPFHDVQAIVEGDAARALGRLVRARWECACGERIALSRARKDCWPDGLEPDFRDIEIAIARTQPAYESQPQVQEIEALFIDSIGKAEHTIYIENQFLTSVSVAKALAERMRQKPDLELLMVGPKGHDSWLETRIIQNGRIRFMNELSAPQVASRVRLMYPEVRKGRRRTHTMVHAKVMIIDDRYLRVGSANLNNRSMATDTECDLFIEAHKPTERAAITDIQNRLLGDHLGASAEQIALARKGTPSLIALADQFQAHGRRLRPIEDGKLRSGELTVYVEGVADPERPIGAEQFVSSLLGGTMPERKIPNILKAVAVGLTIVVAALIWEYTPLAEMIDPKAIGRVLREFAHGPWAPLVVIAIFVIGGLVVFPVVVLIAATAATFGPLFGFIYAAIGTMVSAFVTYLIGALLGKQSLRDLLGPRLDNVRKRVARKGVIAVALIRLVPIAPFTIVNLLAGASEITIAQYLLGTALGMLPGIFMMSVLGHQLSQIVIHPNGSSLAMLAAAVGIWIGMSIGIQMLVSKYWDARY